MKKLRQLFPFFLGILLGLLILIFPLSQFQASELESLQTLAVQLDGRKKPLDTVARETVAQIQGRLNYQATNGEKLDYLETYLSLWFNTRDWNEEPLVLFNYRPLKETIGLDRDRKYFTFAELMRSDLGSIVLVARQKQANNQDLSRDEREALTLENRLALLIDTVGQNSLPLVPHPSDLKGTWTSIPQASQYYSSSEIEPLLATYQSLKQHYQLQPREILTTGKIAARLQTQLRQLSPNIYPDFQVLQKEVNFARSHPFSKAWQLYAIAFIVMVLALLVPAIKGYWTSIGIFAIGLSIQTYGFLERMAIAGRPPVTNMYESVVWVGFGIAAIALLFEFIYRAKYYLLAAAPLSVICLILADSLPTVLDASIKPLVPVLRDNFWLSIHVPTITLSYASFAIALGLGHILLFHYLFNPQAKDRIKRLTKWNYAVLQVGVLLLTTGIILGGIWAHFSWGRFWGWDPKETWALIALMCYVVPLHGRLAGWLGDFGLTVTSVISFNAVLMAWYGVNFVLGTGLHSYGFGTGGSEIIIGSFIALDLLLVAIVASYRQYGLKPLSARSREIKV